MTKLACHGPPASYGGGAAGTEVGAVTADGATLGDEPCEHPTTNNVAIRGRPNRGRKRLDRFIITVLLKRSAHQSASD
jgi:hypothetical protein